MASSTSNPDDENLSESTTTESMETQEIDKDEKPKKFFSNLNNYSKRMILQYLQNEKKYNFEKLLKNFQCSLSDVEDFLNNCAKLSQMNVHSECDSPSFQSINNWLDIFKEKGFNTMNQNEIGIMMKSISILEDHPDPSECNGINFQHLYEFFGNIMNGEPTVELDESTRTFLCDIFGELINDVNSESGDNNLERLKETLLLNENLNNDTNENGTNRTFKEDTFELALDPLRISSITNNDLL